jgi:outer membrane protein TolC
MARQKTPDKRQAAVVLLLLICCGCSAPAHQLRQADQAAAAIIQDKQLEALGRTEPFSIGPAGKTLRVRLFQDQHLPVSHPGSKGSGILETIRHWPQGYPAAGQESNPPVVPRWQNGQEVRLSLTDALQVAARNSRAYMTAKETVFRTALALDLERHAYRTTITGLLTGDISTDRSGDQPVSGLETGAEAGLNRKLKTGAEIATLLTIDLVKLLTMDRSSSLGIFADATISIPLLRGSGRYIAAEPLTQAERDVVYAILGFERFKRNFAVGIAGDYLGVLQQLDQVTNSKENYSRLRAAAQRAGRLAEAGRLPEIQVDQATQDELRAHNSWISAMQEYGRRLDALKVALGLPPDSNISLDRAELEKLVKKYRLLFMSEQGNNSSSDPPIGEEPAKLSYLPTAYTGSNYRLEADQAIALALENRLDLRIAQGKVFDAQRAVVVAADGLRADLTLTGVTNMGERRTLASTEMENARLRPDKGFYSALLTLDLPLERTRERNILRESYLDLEQAVRDLQEKEDTVKSDVRSRLRDLQEARESLKIQNQAIKVANRRVTSTELFLQAGRAQIRDLLEAQDALVGAQNALSAAAVNYRVAELALQRDMGLLEVNEKGLWREYNPEDTQHER